MNNQIIIAHDIKLDKNYTNTLSYTESQMLTLMRDVNHLTAGNERFNVVRTERNTLSVSIDYDNLIKSNYIAFQNPDYSNKWFFAFIDSVDWVSPGTSRIHYTIDVHATFYKDWTARQCFVEREHVSDDTIGKHTIPENLETGEFVVNSLKEDNILRADKVIVMATTIDPSVDSSGNLVGGNNGGGVYGSVKSGYAYYTFDPTKDTISKVLKAFEKAGKSTAIGSIFMLPRILIVPDLSINIDNYLVPNFNSPTNIILDFAKPTTLNGYLPKNNKMFTYPYTYLYLTNNNGGNCLYNYEYFNSSNCEFKLNSVPTPGGSTVLIPQNYKGLSSNTSELLIAPKFPICGYQTDSYINWLTQNAVNNTISLTNSVLQASGGIGRVAAGDLVGGLGSAYSGIMGIANNMANIYQHSLIPPQSSGNTNSGDVMFAINKSCYSGYCMSVKREYAEIIDKYFTRFGYKVNSTKLPNFDTRKVFNYVKIGIGEVIGYGKVPAEYMQEINLIYSRGTTIWHDHDSIGNWDVDNSIK